MPSRTINHVLDQCTRTRHSPLKIHYPGNLTITKPGTNTPHTSTQNAPTFSLCSSDFPTLPSKKYILITLDLDAPAPALSSLLSPILHFLESDLIATGNPDLEGYIKLKSATQCPAAIDYRAPNPPAFSAAHRYIFLVFEQPPDLDGKMIRKLLHFPEDGDVGLWPRVRWDQDGCETKLQLGEVLGGNYMVVEPSS